MKTVVITGVAGLIGSAILDEICEQYSDCFVIGVDNMVAGKDHNLENQINNDRFRFLKMNIIDKRFYAILDSYDVDVFIHMAAAKKVWKQHSTIPVFETNCDATREIVKYCAERGSSSFLLPLVTYTVCQRICHFKSLAI